MVYTTKYTSPPKEVLALDTAELNEVLVSLRNERYFLQSVSKRALPSERVSTCLRNKINKETDVSVYQHRESHKAFYGGLMVCGSVWSCPVCSAKVSERRRLELKLALDEHKKNGGQVAMMTLTFSHSYDDKLKDTMRKFTKAMTRFRSGKRYKSVMDDIQSIGSIRAFEITYGMNGFHPHVHILLFYEKKRLSLKRVEKELFLLWRKACKANELETKENYGLTLQDALKAKDYVTKWGLDQELTKSHVKKGKQGGMTPFDFLRKYGETEQDWYLHLFQDYYFAVKGKRQLHWSKGLKEKFNLGEDKTDEELAKEKTEKADLLGTLEFYQWKMILKLDKRSEFLSWVEKIGLDFALEKIKMDLPSSEKQQILQQTLFD